MAAKLGASKARYAEMPWQSTGYTDEELSKMQRSIHFEKTLTASPLSQYYRGNAALALPQWFVKKYGAKFRDSFTLRTGSSSKSWIVSLSIRYRPPTFPQVKFATGWRAFAAFNGLVKGDSLVFSLTSRSEFDVYIFRGTGNPKLGSSSQAPRKWFDSDSEDKVSTSAPDITTTPLRHSSPSNFDSYLNESENVRDSSSSASASASFASSSASSSASSRGHHDLHDEQEPIDQDELMRSSFTGSGSTTHRHTGVREKKDNEPQVNQNAKKSKSPRFLKQLTAINISRRDGGKTPYMEIPTHFSRSYGSQLHTFVKLQGIREESLARIVACRGNLRGMQTRFFFRAGWREFVNGNNLREGQQLEFTLTTNSFFVVQMKSS